MKVKVKSLSHVQLFVTPWTVAHQTLPSMGFSGQEYWSGLPFPSPGSSQPRDRTQVFCIAAASYCIQTLYSLSHQGSLVIHECSVNAYGLSNEVLCEARMERALYTYNQTHIETHATAQSLVEVMEREVENYRLT